MLKYVGIVRDAIIKYKFDEKAYLYKTFAKIILNDKKICTFMENKNVQSKTLCYRIHGGVIHGQSIKDTA